VTEKQRVKYETTWAKLLAVQDGESAASAFAAVEKLVDNAFGVALEAACLFVEAKAKKLAPVDLGMLRASISHRVRSEGDKDIGEVGTNVEYAPFQEFGAGGRPAANGGKGFLTPALNENKDAIRRILEKKLKDALK
jgi:HK97 gp10 family phage protein